jgi:hypothetical protein
MHDPVEAFADQLIERVAGDLAQRPVDEQPAAVEVQQAGADRRTLEGFGEITISAGRQLICAPACSYVEYHGEAPGDYGALLSCHRPAAAQRPHVDHQAIALRGSPDFSRADLPRQGGAEQRLDRFPDFGREGVGDRLSLAAGGRVAQAVERLAGGKDEAELLVEADYQRLRQLTHRRRGDVAGACDQVVHLQSPRWRHAQASAAIANHLRADLDCWQGTGPSLPGGRRRQPAPASEARSARPADGAATAGSRARRARSIETPAAASAKIAIRT